MCIWQGEYIKSPKIVGDKLEAGIYAFNDNGTPITAIVKLKGYNPATSKWLTFAQTTPNSSGWAGMPMNTITEAMVGTWRMSWEAVDVCGAQSGVPDLAITKVATPMYLSSDKYSIQLGDTVTFSGIYKASAKVGIYDVTDLLDVKVTETTCDIHGDFKVAVNLNIPIGRREMKGKSFDLLPDQSGSLFIDVHPKHVCIPDWHCSTKLDGKEYDGCGHSRDNPLCLPITGCSEGTTRTVSCPNVAGKSYTQKCVTGEWISVDKDTKCVADKEEEKKEEEDDILYYILLAIVVALIFMNLIKGKK